jgi:hypothetical protein
MYFFERVTSANLAEIDIYMKRDAPEYRRIQRHGATVEIPNKDYNIIMHAHRNDLLNATLGSTLQDAIPGTYPPRSNGSDRQRSVE